MSQEKLQQTHQENSSEQKHMFSAWEKCVEEAKEINSLEFKEINGQKILLAPNGKESEYNKYRQQDEQRNYLDNETTENIDNPVNLLARVVRTKTFIEGDEKLGWNGFGDWLLKKEAEPVLYLHGTEKNFEGSVSPQEGELPHANFVSYFVPWNLYADFPPIVTIKTYPVLLSTRKPKFVKTHLELVGLFKNENLRR